MTATWWRCEVCGRGARGGSVEEFGTARIYRCERHPGGRPVALEVADARRRRFHRTHGMSVKTYFDALAQVQAEEGRQDGK